VSMLCLFAAQEYEGSREIDVRFMRFHPLRLFLNITIA
jgi:hypothetical protein